MEETRDSGDDVVLSEMPSGAAEPANPVADLALRLDRAWARFQAFGLDPLDNYDVDEANILNRWLFHHAGHPALLRLPIDGEHPDWQELARRALALTEAQLSFDEPPTPQPTMAANEETGMA